MKSCHYYEACYGIFLYFVCLFVCFFFFFFKQKTAYEILVEGADPATMQIRFAPQFTKIYNPTNCEALNITVPEDYIALG